ncbi:MAG: uracil phosphoribosyltransferase [Kiritimatiellae bacterium]|jgi:uracil phosphoribosyltransferase|nr:uracil phosphoribosyltransferase [Kiritimatiellia bacterium]MBO7299505.1 uracil phosphoribosyltransferase [Kiritimatiellia bacterium]MBQ2282032.1 uracil phosphoribosyltransferase [Kiritimatiellia bacterium]
MYKEVKHPLVSHKLAKLRDKATPSEEFRRLASELAEFVVFEALREMPTRKVAVETPLEVAECEELGAPIIFIPILRAGVGMLDAATKLVPTARVGFLGMCRDHETAQPIEYYSNIPEPEADSIAIVIDPMLATGGSSAAAVANIKAKGYKRIILACLISCPEGIEYMQTQHPDVNIYTAVIDRCLNEKKYILPGLGDAGDRIFNS